MLRAIIVRLNPLLLALVLAACSSQKIKPEPAQHPAPPATEAPIQIPESKIPPDTVKPGEANKVPEIVNHYDLLRAASWDDMEGLGQDDLTKSWAAWLQSCSTLKNKQPWQAVCEVAGTLSNPDSEAIQGYFRQYFTPYRATNTDATDVGLITGYYQPVLKGSRTRTNVYRYPLYSRPDDLVVVELGSLYPELANKRVRGRLTENKVVPYYNRSEIEVEQSPLHGKELIWVDDVIDLFFLQIQGSGIVHLENGEQVVVGYADQNGQAYQSIGRILIERGELTIDKASMQGIKDWARKNPDKLRDLLNSNPSYVFFRELPAGLSGPLGALGVPIAAERSLAIDPLYVPLGAPVFLSTTYPNSSKSLQRLMLAQDTGGAIKGGVRADFFWGTGLEAGKQAGAMKQQGKIWVLLPKTWPISTK
jgi:membrane-bound lytic murein transglycosylase A